MASFPHPNGERKPTEGMRIDPRVDSIRKELEHLRQSLNRPMSDEEQARAMAILIQRQQARQNATRDQIMMRGNIQFDDAKMEEAVRAVKRQRVEDKKLDLSDAKKVFAEGPLARPKTPDPDGLWGLALDAELLSLPADFKGEFSLEIRNLADAQTFLDEETPYIHATSNPQFRLLESICSSVWLMVEVGKQLRPRDIVVLYRTSRTFHDLLDQNWLSTITAWAEHMAPSSWRIFYWKFYSKLTRKDPSGTTWAAPGPFVEEFPRPIWASPEREQSNGDMIRHVPSLKYLDMIVQREIRVRDILACLARSGHRLPKTMHETLKKMWLLMDMSHNSLRVPIIRNQELWTSMDLYNGMMFLIKLQMRFNEPIFGPQSPLLAETFLGCKEGLTPLWELLRRKKYTDVLEVVQRRVRYMVGEDDAEGYQGSWDSYYGVKSYDIGIEHLEGWGVGRQHLMRPDELIVEEAARRELGLEQHFIFMIFWGHVHWKKRINLVPTEEEMYMSDDELPPLPPGRYGAEHAFGKCGNVPFLYDEWQPKHAIKARWSTATKEEKLAVNQSDENETSLALPFEDEEGDFWQQGYKEDGFWDGGLSRPVPDRDHGEHEVKNEVKNEERDQDLHMTGMPVLPNVQANPSTMVNPSTTQQQAQPSSPSTSVFRVPPPSPTTPQDSTGSYHYDYPDVQDPHLLSLLRRYDVFPPEAFRSKPSPDPEQQADDDEGGEGEEEDGNAMEQDEGEEAMDDDALKALADQEYTEGELDFDVHEYRYFLSKVGDDGGFYGDRDPEGDGEDEDEDDDMAHEADLERVHDIPMKTRDITRKF